MAEFRNRLHEHFDQLHASRLPTDPSPPDDEVAPDAAGIIAIYHQLPLILTHAFHTPPGCAPIPPEAPGNLPATPR